MVLFIICFNDAIVIDFSILCACIIIVGVRISRLLGERFGGNLRSGAGKLYTYSGVYRLTFGDFYAIIETSFTA